jgi:hypothetical protein
VVREGVGQGGEMTQALYAHMNNKIKRNLVKQIKCNTFSKITISIKKKP